ncbi:hypothetical protein PIB30_061723 [Stylosanthes scabra]|uniref:Uncharacterized protein n=1 Tax=Stylosanthes scabra TaxID=79078 RepID=A0ABU6WJ85_9FABA|nr:hypothetical protein [Stylosanthes scabra]
MMYDDPWKLKKVLNGSDVENMSSLLLLNYMAEKLVIEVAGYNLNDKEGIKLDICDVDTYSMHTLSLKSGNEFGFHWDPYARHFRFSILNRRMN